MKDSQTLLGLGIFTAEELYEKRDNLMNVKMSVKELHTEFRGIITKKQEEVKAEQDAAKREEEFLSAMEG